ncbi:MAG: peptidyl-prolyl cis-trans isomerase, partial [Bacteroidales bacterium]
MKRSFTIFLILLLVFGACKTKDRIVAEVYHSKLYLSEVQAMIPDGVSEEDSIKFANRYIEDWIMEKVILHEAEKTLSIQEKNFDQDIERFKNSLLVNAYYQK